MLHEAIRLLRILYDIKATTLAEKLNISQAYLSEKEIGKKKIHFRILEAYSEIFGIETSSIMRFAEQLKKDPDRLCLCKKISELIQSF